MATAPQLTHFTYEPDSDNPGWCRWLMPDTARFNDAVLGKQIVRVEAPETARLRMFPQTLHTNAGNKVHGGITLAFADVALFAALYALRGIDAGRSVTVDLSAQFIGGGDPSRPLDAVVDLLRETRHLAFLRGLIVQDDDIVASFSGTVRKPTMT
ncbi:MAG: PaaI family thioesterase [Novosphingobium sp.]